jgi:hypothetical protein
MANVSTGTQLLDLDDDALSLITNALLKLETNSLADTLVFSVLSKRLRALTCSLVFRDVRWPLRGQVEFYPAPLWPYIRYVRC